MLGNMYICVGVFICTVCDIYIGRSGFVVRWYRLWWYLRYCRGFRCGACVTAAPPSLLCRGRFGFVFLGFVEGEEARFWVIWQDLSQRTGISDLSGGD